MQVSFLSDNVQKKLSLLNHAVSSRSQLPILSNFLLEAREGHLYVSATDLEIGISVGIKANVSKEGKTTIPAKNFSDLLSGMGSQKITLEQESTVLNLKGEKVKAVFQTSPPDDFPKLYENKGKKLFSISKEEVESYFSRLSFAAAVDLSRPALSGVLLDTQKEGILFVSTDSYRLSLLKTKIKPLKDNKNQIIIPAKIIKEAMFLNEEEEIVFSVSGESNQVIVSQNETVLVGRLIDEKYPTYEKIIPSDFGTRVEFDRVETLNAIRLSSIFARETANIVKFSVEKERIIVSANSPSVGENSVEVEAKTTGEENEIAFNAKYLLDLFSSLETEEMTFEMNGPLNPGVFKIKGDKSFLHLVMPIRVQD